MDELIEKLKELGFNTYEAKVYLALLKHSPATGYEISKSSGVPQARAYDTLKALDKSGIVVPNAGRPVTYLPISPKQLLNKWETSFKGSINFLREALPNVNDETVEPILNLHGKSAIIKNVEEMLNNAQESIFIEIWKEDAARFGPVLRAAAERGIELRVVGYRGVNFDFCDVYEHGQAHDGDNDTQESRWLIIAVDNKVGLVGSLPAGETIPKAVFTKNSGIVFVIKELVVHDIFLLDIGKELGPELEALYGKKLLKLREKVLQNLPG